MSQIRTKSVAIFGTRSRNRRQIGRDAAGWAAFAVGGTGAILVSGGGVTATGSMLWGNPYSRYVITQSGYAVMETVAEAGISYAAGDTTAFAADNLGVTFTKHGVVNLATGWMGDKYGWSGWGVQQAAETAGDTAVDVLWRGKELSWSLVGINAGSNLVGEALGKALPVVWKQGAEFIGTGSKSVDPTDLVPKIPEVELPSAKPATVIPEPVKLELPTHESRKVLENVPKVVEDVVKEIAEDVAKPGMPKSIDIALGLDSIQGKPALNDFATLTGSYRDNFWRGLGLHNAPPGRFDIAFEQSLNNAIAGGGKIKFNLDSLDIPKALSGDAAERVGRYTEWELQQIVRNRQWIESTDFFLNGRKLTDQELQQLGLSFTP